MNVQLDQASSPTEGSCTIDLLPESKPKAIPAAPFVESLVYFKKNGKNISSTGLFGSMKLGKVTKKE